MRLASRLPLLIASALASALVQGSARVQGPITYRDADTTVKAAKGVLTKVGDDYKFDLSGGVTANSKAQGIDVSAPRMRGTLVDDPARKNARRLNNLVATGAFKLDRTRQESEGTRTTKIRSTGATYTASSAEVAKITLDADAVVIDDKGARNVTLTGNHGEANLRTNGQKADLQSATLVGNVRIRAVQTTKGVATPYTATGDRLEATADADGGSTVVLTGNLKFESQGADEAQITGATKAVLKLDAKGEIVSTTLSTDSPNLVKTRYRVKRKGGT